MLVAENNLSQFDFTDVTVLSEELSSVLFNFSVLELSEDSSLHLYIEK